MAEFGELSISLLDSLLVFQPDGTEINIPPGSYLTVSSVADSDVLQETIRIDKQTINRSENLCFTLMSVPFQPILSKIPAAPMPPPTHIVTIP